MKFISIHIPKTGGKTFLGILSKLYNGKLCHDKKDIPHTGKWGYPKSYMKYDVIHGHFIYDKYIHLNVPYIVWLRDPVKRLISQYFFQKVRGCSRRKGNDVHQVRLIREHMNIVQFAQMKANIMTDVYLCGRPLESFAFVGILERFDDSLKLFEKFTGKKINFSYPIQNVQGVKPYISPGQKKQIAAHNKKDIAYYNNALRRFDREKI